MKEMSPLHIVLVIGIVLSFAASEAGAAGGWVIYWDGSYHGKVIDAETKDPIEGAVVVARYTVSCYRFIQTNSKDVGVQEVLTKADGSFQIPSFWTITTPECLPSYTWFIVFKPKYKSFPGSPDLPTSRVYSPSNPDLKSFEDIFKAGVILELPQLKTKEERKKAKPSPVGDKKYWKRQPNLIKAIRMEWKYLYGEDPGDLYKYEGMRDEE